MALMHNAQYPEVPLLQYAPGNPPFFPQVQCPPMLAPYVAVIASLAANEASMKATQNPARMFTYNLLAANNWQNQAYTEAVWLCCMVLDSGMRKGAYATVEQGLEASVAQTMSLFTSRIIFENHELKSIIDPTIVHGAMQNIGTLNNFMQEFTTGMPVQQQTQYPQQGFRTAPNQQAIQTFRYPQHNQNQPPALYSRYHGTVPNTQAAQNTNPAIGSNTSIFSNTQSASEGSPTDQSRYFRARQAPQETPAQHVPVNQEVSCTKMDWRPSAMQPYLSMVDPRSHAVSYVRRNGDVVEIIQPIQENDMDRGKHAIVLLGNTYPLDGVIRNELMEANVATLSMVTSSDIIDAKATGDGSAELMEINEHIYTTTLVDTFLEFSLFAGRLKQTQYQNRHASCNVYRCFSTIFKPLVTKEMYRGYLENLSSTTSFVKLAQALKAQSAALTELLEGDVGYDKEDADDLALYLNAIDLELTARINSFLANNLSLAGVTISSFMDDIASLRPYLEKKYSSRYSAALDQYEFAIVGGLLVDLSEDLERQLTEQLNEDGMDFKFSFIPTCYSFTYANVLSSELGISVGANESLLIRERESPMLFKIAHSLFRQQDAMDMVPAHNLLLTQDQKTFKLHKGYLSVDSYLISC